MWETNRKQLKTLYCNTIYNASSEGTFIMTDMWNVTEWLVKELPYFYLCKQSPSSFQINYTYLYVQIGSPLYFYHQILCHPHKQHSAYRQTCLGSYTLGRQLYLQTQAVSERQQKFFTNLIFPAKQIKYCCYGSNNCLFIFVCFVYPRTSHFFCIFFFT